MLIWMVHIWTNELFNILVDYITYWVLNCTISLSVVSFDELTPSSDSNLNKPDTVYTKISKYNMKSCFKFCFSLLFIIQYYLSTKPSQWHSIQIVYLYLWNWYLLPTPIWTKHSFPVTA